MTLLIQQLIHLWGEPEGAAVLPDQSLGTICTDSRHLGAGDFFVPLVGERFDGHDFLAQLPDRGAQGAVVCRSWQQPLPAGLLHWRVDDTLAAYQQLARLHRRQLGRSVVAVTGSAGKTTTRELIRAALAPLGPVHASEGTTTMTLVFPSRCWVPVRILPLW